MSRTGLARADEVPPQLQANLVSRLAQYDKNMKARAGDKVGVVIVTKKDDIDSDRLAARVRELAEAIAAGPRIAVQVAKQLIDGESTGASPALMEALASGYIAGTDDLREGVEAFRGKRKPRFGA